MKATIAVASTLLAVLLVWSCGRTPMRCLSDQDCAAVNSSVCAVCPAFQNQFVCWQGECTCACEVDGGELVDGGVSPDGGTSLDGGPDGG